MSDQSGFNYITRGRRWARGWNRYEARTMNWLFGILIIPTVLGLIAGLVVGTRLQFLPWLIILTVVVVGSVALLIGVAVAKAIIPFVWETMLTKELEE